MTDQPSQRHISHEMRTPMNHIIGYSELLLEDAEDQGLTEVVAALTEIRATGKRLIARLNEVFVNRAIAPHITLGAARSDLVAIAQSVSRQTTALNAHVPPDMQPDLKKIDTATANFIRLVDVFAQPPAASDVAVAAAPANPEPSHLRIAPGHLLIVDDNADNRDVLAQLLRRQGHTITLAENGREALEKLAGSTIDLVLLDIMMPIMDGFETLRRIKAADGLRNIPVIVVSALDEIQSVVRCIEGGAEDYMTKPFDPILLRARINAGLERRRLRTIELEYLDQVGLLTFAAHAVETETFEPETLSTVSARPDALGNLARVFLRMAHEIYDREALLRGQARQIQVTVNPAQTEHRVDEIVSTEFFQRLKQNTRRLGTAHPTNSQDINSGS